MQLTKKIIMVAMAALALNLAAQEKPAQEKKVKDQAEYDLYKSVLDSIGNASAAATRLQTLDKWKSGYAESDFADIRRKAYLITYQQMNNHKSAIEAAQEILKTDDPNEITALTEILGAGLTVNPPNTALVEKTAEYVIGNVDAIYAPAKKPQGVTDQQWASGKPIMTNFAQYTLANAYLAEKNNAKAEEALKKTVQLDPTNAQASYKLAGLLLAQQQSAPEKMPLALFEYARAANYESSGPNGIPPANRTQINTFLDRAYATYHGPDAAMSNDKGKDVALPELKTMAKSSALPPADFKIKSSVEIAQEKEGARQEALKNDPMGTFWNTVLKENLVKDPNYWEMGVKDTGLPPGGSGFEKFKGKLVEAKPATRPKELVLAIAGDQPNATLKFDDPLPGTMEPGGEISFKGTAKAFTADPFMITFEVNQEDVEGWTGKGTRAPARTGAKKAAPKKE